MGNLENMAPRSLELLVPGNAKRATVRANFALFDKIPLYSKP